MSSSPSLQPLYNFNRWIIKDIKLSSDVATIKICHDKRLLHKCPFCGQKMGENRRLWQVAKDLPLGTAHLVEIIYEAIQGYCSNCKHYLSAGLPLINSLEGEMAELIDRHGFGLNYLPGDLEGLCI